MAPPKTDFMNRVKRDQIDMSFEKLNGWEEESLSDNIVKVVGSTHSNPITGTTGWTCFLRGDSRVDSLGAAFGPSFVDFVGLDPGCEPAIPTRIYQRIDLECAAMVPSPSR